MIFITTGSRNFQFNRLLKAVDLAIEKGLIDDVVYAQIGESDYKAQNYNYEKFLSQDMFDKKINDADIVITHGGSGIIVKSVKMGKRVIAIPRLSEYGEAVDNHQIELVKAFEQLGIITPCFECVPEKISNAIMISRKREIPKYVSNTERILYSISEYINQTSIIRVLMCGSNRREKGGINSVIDQLMDYNWGDEFEFDYLATHISGNNIKKIMYFINAYLKLKKLIRNNTFDVIHVHMSYRGSFYRKYYIAKLCKKKNKKVIIHLHGSEFKDFYNNGNSKRKNQIIKLFGMVDAVIVLGEMWREFILSISPKANVIVINNAVKNKITNHKQINGELKFLYLGALIKRKGISDLLNAVQIIVNEGVREFKLFIAGEGAEKESLTEFVKKNNLSGYVEFLGWISGGDKESLFENTDVLVLPSYNEGLPIAILEAMSYGLPIISTNVGSISEAVKANYNGFLIDAGNIEELKNCMEFFILNREKYGVFSSNSFELQISKFSEGVFIDKISGLYKELCR